MTRSKQSASLSDNDNIKLAVMANDMKYLRDSVDSIDQKISSSYVTKEEFQPVKNIVFGLVGLMVLSVTGALISLVLRK